MKYMFASDIHGSAYYCKKMLEAYKAEQADRFILLGDLLYHGPRNDLPKDYAPKEVIAMLNDYKDECMWCAATVMRKWIKWYFIFRSWRITVL